VKHWQETARVLDRALRLAREGRASAVAVVTQIKGSAYRRPGAKLLVEEGGPGPGGVSGGCLEEDVREVGRAVLRSGRARVLHYDTSDDETRAWGLGLGCNGEVDLVVLPIPAEGARAWAGIRELLEGDAPVTLAMEVDEGGAGGVLAVAGSGAVVDGLPDPAAAGAVEQEARAALGSGRCAVRTVAGRQVFFESLVPPPTLLVCGAGDDARPLVALASSVGFRVVVADHRTGYLRAELLPEAQHLVVAHAAEVPTVPLPLSAESYAVVKTHSLRHDTAWVRRLIQADLPYVGLLGPRARTRRILEGLGAPDDPRVFGPVGLDLGADGPEQVAVSVVAELLSVRARRPPAHLRERDLAVHVEG
jgi:xanthine/CO dehydrogenase XdhC/CoxF family maturation factor